MKLKIKETRPIGLIEGILYDAKNSVQELTENIAEKPRSYLSSFISGGIIFGMNFFRATNDPIAGVNGGLAAGLSSLFIRNETTNVQFEGLFRSLLFASVVIDNVDFNVDTKNKVIDVSTKSWTMLTYGLTSFTGAFMQYMNAILKDPNSSEKERDKDRFAKKSFSEKLKMVTTPKQYPVQTRHALYGIGKIPVLIETTLALVQPETHVTKELLAKEGLIISLIGNFYAYFKTPEKINPDDYQRKNTIEKQMLRYREKPNKFGADTAMASAVPLTLIYPEGLSSIVINTLARDIHHADYGKTK